jgi:cytidyltransferase-like protein
MFEKIKAKVLKEEELSAIRSKYSDKKIVLCSGCYDILQSGHAVFFNQCKDLGDILVVGVGRDSVINQLKGPGRPVNPESNRVHLVAAMHDVDFAVLNGSEIRDSKIDFENIIAQLHPDIFVLNDDDSGIPAKQALCNKYGVSLQFVKREVPEELEATSTTHIIDVINFSYKAPLRIDFAGGWADVPFIMDGEKGYVSNVAIKPLIEYKSAKFNFSGYPRGSGLSTSTAAKLLEMISAKNYNVYSKSLNIIAEDLFKLENKELNWAIGRQDQYAIVYGGYNCFEFGADYGAPVGGIVSAKILNKFREKLLLIHTGVSRNAQLAVEQVYQNYSTLAGKDALRKLSQYGLQFHETLMSADLRAAADIMEANFKAQKQLAPASSNEHLDEIYQCAKANGAYSGKICGAGGGGAFVFYCEDPTAVKLAIKKKFVDCFEIDFDFELKNIKELNTI